ncbi:MAG: hypothetical protein ACWGQW_03160 [bacterium]
MDKLLLAFADMREWKDEYAKIFEESFPDAEKNHAVAMELFSRLEEFFVGLENDFSDFEAMLRGRRAEDSFSCRQDERRVFCYGESAIDLLVEADEERGIPHDYLHFPVLPDYVREALECLKQFNELPDHAQKFLELAISSLIRDQLTYFSDTEGECFCQACAKDREESRAILAKAEEEEDERVDLFESMEQLVSDISALDSDERDQLLSQALFIKEEILNQCQ